MRGVLMLAAASSLLTGGTAEVVAQDIWMSGTVELECAITGLSGNQFFLSLENGQLQVVDGIGMMCNAPDGAALTLTSAEGGLNLEGEADVGICYQARLNFANTGVVLDADASGGVARCSALGGTGPVGGVKDKAESLDVALIVRGQNVVNNDAQLVVQILDTAALPGDYSDTLTVEVNAR
ncbi:MAG: hypothetical protein ACR2P3_09935 [Geminicoccaceae bacterium]